MSFSILNIVIPYEFIAAHQDTSITSVKLYRQQIYECGFEDTSDFLWNSTELFTKSV